MKAIKDQLYDYLISELYPLPSCDQCQYSDPNVISRTCERCECWDKYKLHKGHKADLKRMAREIIKIVKGN